MPALVGVASGAGAVGIIALSKVIVPTVKNLTGAAATVALNALGLLVTEGFAPSTQAVNIVTAQAPLPGASVSQGSTVALTLSSGNNSPVTPPAARAASLPRLPNQILSPTVKLVDETGAVKANWWQFLLNVSNQAFGVNSPPEVTVPVGASPFTFSVVTSGALIVNGGPVTGVSYSHNGSPFYPTGQTGGVFQMLPGDQVIVTYTNLPSLTFFPR